MSLGNLLLLILLSIHREKFQNQISEENLSLSFEYSNDGINFVSASEGHYDDGLLSIKTSGENDISPELEGVQIVKLL